MDKEPGTSLCHTYMERNKTVSNEFHAMVSSIFLAHKGTLYLSIMNVKLSYSLQILGFYQEIINPRK